MGMDSIRWASKLIYYLFVKFEFIRIKGLLLTSVGVVIHRIITGTKQQPGGGWVGVFPSLIYMKGDLQKGTTTHIGMQRQWRSEGQNKCKQ